MSDRHCKISFGIDYRLFCNRLNIVVAPVTVKHIKCPCYVFSMRRIVIDEHLRMMRYVGFDTLYLLIIFQQGLKRYMRHYLRYSLTQNRVS